MASLSQNPLIGARMEWRDPEGAPRTRRDEWNDATGRSRSRAVLEAEADQFNRDLSGHLDKLAILASLGSPVAGGLFAAGAASASPDKIDPTNPEQVRTAATDMALSAMLLPRGGPKLPVSARPNSPGARAAAAAERLREGSLRDRKWIKKYGYGAPQHTGTPESIARAAGEVHRTKKAAAEAVAAQRAAETHRMQEMHESIMAEAARGESVAARARVAAQDEKLRARILREAAESEPTSSLWQKFGNKAKLVAKWAGIASVPVAGGGLAAAKISENNQKLERLRETNRIRKDVEAAWEDLSGLAAASVSSDVLAQAYTSPQAMQAYFTNVSKANAELYRRLTAGGDDPVSVRERLALEYDKAYMAVKEFDPGRFAAFYRQNMSRQSARDRQAGVPVYAMPHGEWDLIDQVRLGEGGRK